MFWFRLTTVILRFHSSPIWACAGFQWARRWRASHGVLSSNLHATLKRPAHSKISLLPPHSTNSTIYSSGEREAILLTPWLQPGGQVLHNNSLNRFQRFLLSPANKTVRNGSL